MTDIDTQAVHRQTPTPTAEVAEAGDIWITGTATVADILVAAGQVEHVLKGTVARTDTTAKTLGVLPAGAFITELVVSGPAASDAGTTATLSVGKVGGSGHDYLNALDVKGATGSGQQLPSGTVLGSVGGAAVTVTGTYAESGDASTTGGPWTVVIRFTTS